MEKNVLSCASYFSFYNNRNEGFPYLHKVNLYFFNIIYIPECNYIIYMTIIVSKAFLPNKAPDTLQYPNQTFRHQLLHHLNRSEVAPVSAT